MKAERMIYDAVGVGFGPSNLALAIALDEVTRRRGRAFRAHFIEKQQSFAWHGGMLLPGSDMQISFLKDLVLMRDPTSRFTFLNYLHARGRLEFFINQKSFYPSRTEFNDYLTWAAGQFPETVSYGEEVLAIEPDMARGPVTHLAVRSRDAAGQERTRLARNLVLAVGGRAKIPPLFQRLGGDSRAFHSSSYLSSVAALGLADTPATRIAVIGRGQSAAEIALDLHSRFSHARIDMITRGFALRPADDTPFVNEIFNPAYTDFIYNQPEHVRDAILGEFRNTNYAVVDADLIRTLYGILYQQKVAGTERLSIMSMREVVDVGWTLASITLNVRDCAAGTCNSTSYDAVVLATGYDRDNGGRLLEGLSNHLPGLTVERNYRLKATSDFAPSIYMQGTSEATHGLSDTLLSVLAIRAEEIASALLVSADARQSAA
jgi:L-ornithine N5-monooxygenase